MQEPLTDMERDEILKAFGARVKDLRKRKSWTQKQLAATLDVRFSQLNKYESGLHAPPLDNLVQLAEILDTSVDYLLTGDPRGSVPLSSIRLLDRFRALEASEADDRETAIKLIDALIVKRQVEGALRPFESR